MVAEPLPSRGEVKKLYEVKAEAEDKLKKWGAGPEQEPEPPQVYDPAHFTDEGNATLFVALHHKNIRFVQKWERWMVWNGEVWQKKKSKQMTEYVRDMTRNMRRAAESISDIKKSNQLMEYAAKTESYSKMVACISIAENDPLIAVQPDDFDKDDMLLNLKNGILDLRTGKLGPHDREKMQSMMANAEYVEGATAPEFERFLKTILADNPNLLKYTQQFFGSCLSGEVREKQLLLFHGKMDAGKTTFTELVGDILGEYADSIPISSLLSERKSSIPNDIAKLHNKRFVYSVEPEFGDKLSESTVKRLTGRDSIDARFLNQEWFKFKPKFKLLIACNNPPAVKNGGDSATWNRIKGVLFNVTIPKDKIKTDLPEKLRAEIPGILNWLIAGCLAWQKEGMVEPPEVKLATADYKEAQDKYSEFFNTCCLNVPKENEENYGITPSNILYTAFKLWCEVADIYPIADTKFGYYLTNTKGYETKSPRDATGRRFRGYRGIRIVDDILPAIIDMLKCDSDKYFQYYTIAKDKVRKVVNKSIDDVPKQEVKAGEEPILERAVRFLKETWDHRKAPEKEDVTRLRRAMRESLRAEIEEIDEMSADKIVAQYFTVRGW